MASTRGARELGCNIRNASGFRFWRLGLKSAPAPHSTPGCNPFLSPGNAWDKGYNFLTMSEFRKLKKAPLTLHNVEFMRRNTRKHHFEVKYECRIFRRNTRIRYYFRGEIRGIISRWNTMKHYYYYYFEVKYEETLFSEVKYKGQFLLLCVRMDICSIK